MIRNAWYVLGLSGELAPGELHAMTVVGQPMVVWRGADGAAHALDGRCMHKRFPLAMGRLLDDGSLECAYHGFRYNGNGRCVGIPALDGSPAHLERLGGVRCYPLVEQDGLVWAWTGDATAEGDPPRTPEVAADGWDAEAWGPCTVHASARLLIENLFDLTHFYPLHAANIGTFADAAVAVDMDRSPDGTPPLLTTTRRREDFRFGKTKGEWFGVEVGDNVATHQMVVPGLFRAVERVAPSGELDTDAERAFVLYHTITPVDEEHHVWRRVVCSRRVEETSPGLSLAARVTADCVAVAEEDRWALEAQQEMFAFPDGSFREVNIKSDAPVLMARRILDDLEMQERRVPTAAG